MIQIVRCLTGIPICHAYAKPCPVIFGRLFSSATESNSLGGSALTTIAETIVASQKRKTRRAKAIDFSKVGSEYPNVFIDPLANSGRLHNEKFPDMRQNYIQNEQNHCDLRNQTSFPYFLEEDMISEMVAITKGLYLDSTVSGHFLPLVKLASIPHDGLSVDTLMCKLVQGLCREISGDFCVIDDCDYDIIVEALACIESGFSSHSSKLSATTCTIQGLDIPVSESLKDYIDKNIISGKISPSMSEMVRKVELLNRRKLSSSSSHIFEQVIKYIHACMNETSHSSRPKVLYFRGANIANIAMSKSDFWKKHLRQADGPIIIFTQEDMKFSENSSSQDQANSSESQAVNSKIKPEVPFFWQEYQTFKKLSRSRSSLAGETETSFFVDKSGEWSRFFVAPSADMAKRRSYFLQLKKDRVKEVVDYNYRKLKNSLQYMGLDVENLPIAAPVEFYSEDADISKTILCRSELNWISFITKDLCIGSRVLHQDLQNGVARFFRVREIQSSHESPGFMRVVGGKQALDLSTLNKYERRLVTSVISGDSVSTAFDDIGALDKVKEALHDLISLRLEKPSLFKHGILKSAVSGILLFGPPGTGKTLLAKAVATQCGANFLVASSATIYDMYLGEAEKNAKALFSLARKLAPCVIFIDEIDALLENRNSSLNKPARVEVLNEFMAEWDGVISNNQGVIVMGATNRPFALDDAVLRRLPRRILVDLPNAAERLSILKIVLKDNVLGGDVDLKNIAETAEAYSGSDLKNLCISAALRAVKEARSEESPIICKRHFEAAFIDVPASLTDSMDSIVELRRWDRAFGQARTKTAAASLGFDL